MCAKLIEDTKSAIFLRGLNTSIVVTTLLQDLCVAAVLSEPNSHGSAGPQ